MLPVKGVVEELLDREQVLLEEQPKIGHMNLRQIIVNGWFHSGGSQD